MEKKNIKKYVYLVIGVIIIVSIAIFLYSEVRSSIALKRYQKYERINKMAESAINSIDRSNEN